MFTRREDNQAICFCSNHVPGRRIKDSVKNGDSVELRIGNERVMVRNVQARGNSEFYGEVIGFEPSEILELGSVKIGDRITFEEAHVFSCSS